MLPHFPTSSYQKNIYRNRYHSSFTSLINIHLDPCVLLSTYILYSQISIEPTIFFLNTISYRTANQLEFTDNMEDRSSLKFSRGPSRKVSRVCYVHRTSMTLMMRRIKMESTQRTSETPCEASNGAKKATTWQGV